MRTLHCLLTLLLGCHSSGSDTAWWLVSDVAGVPLEECGEDDCEDSEDHQRMMWGDIALSSSSGLVGFILSDPDQGGLICELSYEMPAADEIEDCTECQIAWSLTYGEAAIETDEDDACTEAGWSDLEGSTLRVGMSDQVAWLDTGEGFQAAGDAGEDEGLVWFDIWLAD